MRIRNLLVIALIAVTATPSLAAAPLTAAQQARINELLREAADERRLKRLDAALETLQEALAIALDPVVLVNLARTYEELGRYDEARAQYSACLPATVAKEVQQAAREGLARLDVLQATGMLHIRVTPIGASLSIGGVMSALSEEGKVALTPGVHRLSLSHAGYESHAQDVQITGGKTTSLTVNLSREPEYIHVVAPATVQPVDFGAWPWLALGTGLALAGVGTYLVLDGAQDFNDEDGLPKAEAAALIEQGRTKQTVGYVGLGVGGALIGTAIILFLLESPGSDPDTEGDARLELGPLPGGGNATLTWDF